MSNTPSIIQTQQYQTPDLLLRSIGTGDLNKTEEAYKKAGLRYVKPPQQIKEEKWYAQVVNQNTNEFFQPEHLRAAGLVPQDYENNKKYPTKILNTLIRLRTVEGKEWILSRQMWTGLDRLGNEITKVMEDKEMWLKPVFRYGQRHTNPGDPFSKAESRISSVSDFVKEYTLPFNAKNLDELYKLKRVASPVSLVLKHSDPGNPPRSVAKYEDLRNMEFDELHEILATPKFSLDRSIKDNLHDSHYG